MNTNDQDARVDMQVERIRAEYADEEAEAAQEEVAQHIGALDIPLNIRVDRDLHERLKERSRSERIPVSALVRGLLHRALDGPSGAGLTVADVEAITRRVLAEDGAAPHQAR